MIASITPTVISGTVTAPPSKSAMQRACALALLHDGITKIQNPGKSADDLAAIKIIQQLGAHVSFDDDVMIVSSNGKYDFKGKINCVESGLSLRMFAAITALSKYEVTIEGEGSLLKRPIDFFEKTFPSLGIKVNSTNGSLPITIQGPIIPANIEIDGSLSSQYLTGLLFALANCAGNEIIITVKDLKSKPYVDLSLQMLELFGYNVQHEDHKKFIVSPRGVPAKNISYHTEGDWSAASFLLVAAAIAGEIRLQGLDIYSLQADRAIIEVLQQAGANVNIDGTCILVNNKQPLKAFEFDATDSPDLFPSLVTLASYCKGESEINGISRLAGKESDRTKSLTDVFSKLGIAIRIKGDSMVVTGGTEIRASKVSAHHDHRIAMAAAVAALNADGAISIEHAESVNKSYPDFYQHLRMLGATVSLTDK